MIVGTIVASDYWIDPLGPFLKVLSVIALTLVAGWIAGQPDALGRFAIVAPVMLVYAFISNFTYALAGALLREVEIFDVFRGPQIGEDKKAIALRLRLNAGDRTLEMSEALAVRAAVTSALREHLRATIRE